MSLSVEKVIEKHASDPTEVKALIERRRKKRILSRIRKANRLKIQRFMTISKGRKSLEVCSNAL